MSRATIWIFWTVIIVINTIIFLNFLIAVISDVYEQVMETRTEEIFQKKAQLIVDIDEVLSDKRRLSAKILVTRSGEFGSAYSEWSGFLKELKQEMIDQTQLIETRMTRNTDDMTRLVEQKHQETSEQITNLTQKVLDIERLVTASVGWGGQASGQPSVDG